MTYAGEIEKAYQNGYQAGRREALENLLGRATSDQPEVAAGIQIVEGIIKYKLEKESKGGETM